MNLTLFYISPPCRYTRDTTQAFEPTLSTAERRMIASFSCRTAQCERAADRQRILAEIRKGWGSEVSFDVWMRDSMEQVLLWSKRE